MASEFARNVEARAIAAGMPPETFGDLPEHGVLSFSDLATKAVDLLHSNPEEALAIALVEKDVPPGQMRAFIVKAVENKARREGDWETLRKLGTNQKLADENTTIGRNLAAMANMDPSDPVAALRVVAKARAAKQPKGALKADLKDVKDEIKKARSTKNALTDLISEWTCK